MYYEFFSRFMIYRLVCSKYIYYENFQCLSIFEFFEISFDNHPPNPQYVITTIKLNNILCKIHTVKIYCGCFFTMISLPLKCVWFIYLPFSKAIFSIDVLIRAFYYVMTNCNTASSNSNKIERRKNQNLQ